MRISLMRGDHLSWMIMAESESMAEDIEGVVVVAERLLRALLWLLLREGAESAENMTESTGVLVHLTVHLPGSGDSSLFLVNFASMLEIFKLFCTN